MYAIIEDFVPDRMPDVEYHYRYRDSYAMALALHDRTGWPIGGLIVSVPIRGGAEHTHVVHAWVTSPDGRKYDVGGYFDDTVLKSLIEPPARFIDPKICEFGDADSFISFLRASSIAPGFWHIAKQRLEEGRAKAAQVVEDYVFVEHPIETPTMRLN